MKEEIIMAEYGGFLPIELSRTAEYYNDKNTVRLNSGRSAVVYAVWEGNYERIYIPIYLCKSVSEMLNRYNIKYEYYNIDEQFLPQLSGIHDTDVLLYPNYYGILPQETIDTVIRKYKNVIIDNTQAFFYQPNLQAYNVYSCRKFFGVSDGAYLIKKDIKHTELKKDTSYGRASHLLKSIDLGTQAAYDLSLENEKAIDAADVLAMSNLTQRILASIDYNKVRIKRYENFIYMHSKLAHLNSLDIELTDQISPVAYPLLIHQDGIRNYLVKNKIYIPQWWNFILDCDISNSFERELSKYLLPVPIDQRYETSDLNFMIMHICSSINNKT